MKVQIVQGGDLKTGVGYQNDQRKRIHDKKRWEGEV